MGIDNHIVVSHKPCGVQGRVGWPVVLIKEPVVVAPKFRSYSSHIFSQASQNVTVKVRVDRSVMRNKFMVELSNSFNIVVLLVFDRPECSSFSTNTRPALKREFH
jgi:hypothetical protein